MRAAAPPSAPPASAGSADDSDPDSAGPWPPDDSVREKVASTDGVIAITRDSTSIVRGHVFRVFVDGTEVLADSLSREVRLVTVSQSLYPGVVAVLELVPGAGACAARYRIVHTRGSSPALLSPAFGNCGRLSGATWSGGGLRMDFPAPSGERWEYRDSTLVRHASGAAPVQSLALRHTPGAWLPAGSERASRLRARVTTPDGVLTVSRGPADGESVSPDNTVTVDGRTLLPHEFGLSMQVYALVPRTARHGTLVVLALADGGNACDARFRVVELRGRQPPRVTDEFGNCAGLPALDTRGGLRLEFGPFWTHYAEADPHFRKPPGQAFEYRAGAMVRVPLAGGTRTER